MKQWIIVAGLLCASGMALSQQTETVKVQADSIFINSDTVKVGNFIIIQKNRNLSNRVDQVTNGQNKRINNVITISTKPRNKKNNQNVVTNWGILDLGFANINDNTNYTAAQGAGYLTTVNGNPVTKNNFNLRTGKSSNVNIWFFMQKLNVAKHVVNLKYGLGLEMYNFRFEDNISFRSNPQPMVFNDTINFSKNKLYVGYLTIPFMVNFNLTPYKDNGLSFSAGVSAGYLLGSRNKQISNERGKVKYKGDFNLQPWRVAAIAELGLGPIRLYGSYSLNNLYKESTGLDQIPYAVGIRFSRF
ncbi:outer membrane beta-barrel protein [Hydrotalea sp.]|uniref:outer membrane beta-barrel protein n=1 Tax=Hydrotalea sp. TaxID=2881279 RepID=UPI003D0E07D2